MLIVVEVIKNQLDSKLDFYPLIVIVYIVLLVLFVLSFIETIATTNIIPKWVIVALFFIIYYLKIPYLLIVSISLFDIIIQLRKYYLYKRRR